MYDVRADVVCVVLGHQSRRQVDADDGGGALVDVLHQRGEPAREGLVESRTEQSVDDERTLGQLGWVELRRHLDERLRVNLVLAQPLEVGGAVGGEVVGGVEEVNLHVVSALQQQPGYGQGVAAVVSRAGKNHYWRAVGPLFGDGHRENFRRTLHEVDRLNLVLFYRIFVQLMQLGACENLHNDAKLQNKSDYKWVVCSIFCNFAGK